MEPSAVVALAVSPATPLEVAVFGNKLVKVPRTLAFATFGALVTWLAVPTVAESKDAVHLWSPVSYAQGADRSAPTEKAITSI